MSLGGCRKLDEQTKLGEALTAHLKLQPGQAQRHALLKEYVDAGPEHLTLLLRQEKHSVSIQHLLQRNIPVVLGS